MALEGATVAVSGTVVVLALSPAARESVGLRAVGLGADLPVPLAFFAAFGEPARFAAVTTTRACGCDGGLALGETLGGAAFAALATLAAATSGFFATFAAATTGVFTAFGTTAFVAGRLTDFGGAAGGFMGDGLSALLDGAFAVATVERLLLVAVVLSDFFVVNL